MDHDELRQRLRWLVRLRWIGIAAVLAGTHMVRSTAFLSFSLAPVYAILGCTALYNLAVQHRLRRAGGSLLRLSVVQILLDQIVLTAAVYFSGGCDSPFTYFFLFHVVISGTLLPDRFTYVFGALAVIFPGTIMGLKHLGILPHFGIFRDEPTVFADMAVMGSYGSVYIATVGLTAYFVTYLSSRLHHSREALQRSNRKLQTLLDASRLTTSSLELDTVLSSSLQIILNVTNLRSGVILLLEENPSRKCHEFFDCTASNCPAYKSGVNCWLLSGTLCHGDGDSCPRGREAEACWREDRVHSHGAAAMDMDQKVRTCSRCSFFSDVVLMPRIVSGYGDGKLAETVKLDGGTIHQALIRGTAIIDHSRDNPLRFPYETATEIAIPLKIQGQMAGIFYLASDSSLTYRGEEVEFFQFLTEVVSSGILNSKMFGDMEDSYLQTVMAMENAVDAQDPYTRGHSTRVAEISARMAAELRLTPQEHDHLRFAALLHDVGKIGISRDILRKPGRLDDREEREMRTHCSLGAQILGPVRFLQPVLSAIRHHHENFDGTGYPDGLKGMEIPLKARIIKVADAWDAMRSDRPYRSALTLECARQELVANSGTQFDPQIVNLYLRMPCPAEATLHQPRSA